MTTEIDEKLNTKVIVQKYIAVFIEMFYETLQPTCEEKIKHLNSPNTTAKE